LWAGPCEDLLADAADLSARREFASAATRLDLAPADCRNDERVLLELARAHVLAGQFDKSLAASARLVALHPRSVAAWRAKADAHYLLGQDDDAEGSLLRALAIEPENEEAAYSLGRVYYYRSRYPQACAMFEKVTARNPGAYKAWDNLGLCQEGMGQPDAARKSYLRAIELVHKAHPGYDWPYANLAGLLLKNGENRQAFDLAVEASARNPNSAQNFYLAAKALTKLDQWGKSVRWLVRAVELEASYPEPHYLLGQVYRKLGKPAESDREFLRFKELKEKAVNRPR
jgi:tetratricopeptide (TPR) repeat protein